jgi:hypothetical protein
MVNTKLHLYNTEFTIVPLNYIQHTGYTSVYHVFDNDRIEHLKRYIRLMVFIGAKHIYIHTDKDNHVNGWKFILEHLYYGNYAKQFYPIHALKNKLKHLN